MRTGESQSVTRALIRTRQVAQQFIVRPRALGDPVTDMARMQTRLGVKTAVITWTQVAVTVHLVLVTRTVVDSVTSREDGPAVSVPRTFVVGVGANRGIIPVVCVPNGSDHSPPIFRKVDDCGWGGW